MPEGDTIHKLAKALSASLTGRCVDTVRLRSGPVRGLSGKRVTGVVARGKHCLINFEGGWSLRNHLGMYGSWHRYACHEAWRKPARQAAIVIDTGRETLVCFNAREVELMQSSGLQYNDLSRRLGPDLVNDNVDFDALLARTRALAGPQTPIVDVLLEQKIAAGIGNVYKSEVLFLERLSPLTQLTDISDRALRSLFCTASHLMRENLKGGPRITRFEADGRGERWVYKRRGLPCLKCQVKVRYARMGKDMRSTYWCPRCQSFQR